VDADPACDPRTLRLRRASRASFAVALTFPAFATVAGWITETQGALIVGTLLLPLLFGAMLANLLGWYRTIADKARIYLAVGSVFAVWSGAEVLVAAATAESPTPAGDARPGAAYSSAGRDSSTPSWQSGR
jgi:hypothetical protein